MASLRNTIKTTFNAVEHTLNVIPVATTALVDIIQVGATASKEFSDSYKSEKGLRQDERQVEREERENNVIKAQAKVMAEREELLADLPSADEIKALRQEFTAKTNALFGRE